MKKCYLTFLIFIGVIIGNKGNAQTTTPIISFAEFTEEMSKFLVERTKSEMTVAFWEKTKKQMDNSKELQHLFKKTYVLMKNKDNFLNAPMLGQVWLEAFQSDMVNLVPNFEKMVLTLDKYSSYRDEISFQLFTSNFNLLNEIQKGDHLSGVIERLRIHYSSINNAENYKYSVYNIFELVGALSLIIKVDDENKWMTFDEFNKLSKTQKIKKIDDFRTKNASLLAQIKTKSGDNLYNLLGSNNNDKIKFINTTVLSLLATTDRIQDAYNRSKGNKLNVSNKKELAAYFIEYSELTLQIVDIAYRAVYFSKPMEYYKSEYFNTYKPILESSLETVKGLYRNDYGKVFLNIGIILNEIYAKYIEDDKRNLVTTYEDKLNNLNTKIHQEYKQRSKNKSFQLDSEYDLKVNNGTISFDSKTNPGKIIKLDNQDFKAKRRKIKFKTGSNDEIYQKKLALKNILKFGLFVTDIITADSTTNMQVVLETYASPPGSYSIKRNSKFTIELQAYPGFAFGTEMPTDTSVFTFASNITAPLGINFSYGTRWSKWSHSLFFSIIDLGAPFAYSWKQDSKDNNKKEVSGGFEELEFSNVFAPGVFYSIGIPRNPLSIKIGAQYAPQLRKMTIDGVKLRDVDVIQFTISASIDIPLFKLYSYEREY